jgi:hypothetical protein
VEVVSYPEDGILEGYLVIPDISLTLRQASRTDEGHGRKPAAGCKGNPVVIER